jgi:hypothetical protein
MTIFGNNYLIRSLNFFSSPLGHLKWCLAKVSHFYDFLISCDWNVTHQTSWSPASSAVVLLLGGARNWKGWAGKVTRFGAKNIFLENLEYGKVDAVQIRPDSSDIGRRRWRILWLPGELSRGAGVWSVLLMCSSIDVHEFPSTLVCAHVPGSHQKKSFWHSENGKQVLCGHDGKNPIHIVDSHPRAHTYALHGLI